MSKVDIKRLDSVTKNDTTATEQINDNFQALQQAIENTVSRNGKAPNYMDANLDLNSYRIINAGDPVNEHDVVTVKYFEEQAGGAIEAAAEAKANAAKAASSAQSALVASNNAIGQVAKAESLLLSAQTQLTDTQEYVDTAKADINNVASTAKADINNVVATGKQEISTTIGNAQANLSDTINQAVEDVKQEAVAAANAVIEDAGTTATQIATTNINDYTMNTVVPQLNALVEAAEEDANSADEDAKAAGNYAREAKAWARGEDAEVEEFAPGQQEHSSRGYADLAMAIANTPEDVPVDTSTLLALDVIRGPKGDSGDAEFSGDVTFIGTFDVHSDSNHPVKVTGMAGTSASGFQIVDSNGLGDSDFEHYATGDRYGTRITNHNNTSDTSVSVDLYQSNVGKSVLDVTDVDTVLVKGLQVDGADVVKTSGNQTVGGVKTLTSAPNLSYATALRVPMIDNSKNLVSSGITTTELGYMNGLTSNIQTQLNDTVKTSGNQTVGGTKIYTSDICRKSDAIALSTSPSTNQFLNVSILDKNNAAIGIWEYRHLTGNGSGMSMVLRKRGSDSSAVWGRIGIFQDTSGNFYTEAPTPVAADSSTQIATTAWVTSNGTKNSFKPNWGGKVSVAYNTNYTAPNNGFIVAYVSDWNISTSIKINNVELYKFFGNVISGTMVTLPVCKGDIVNITTGTFQRDDIILANYFVPFK